MKSRLLALSLLLPLLLSAAPVAKAQDGPIIVAVFLMESQGSGLKADEVVNLTDYLATMLGAGGKLQIIPRDEIRKRLVQSKSESHKECYDTSCQIELGRELAAQYSISSKIGRVGRQCLITAQVFDLKTSTMIKAVPGRGPCDPDSLINSVTALAEELKVEMLSRPVETAPVVDPDPVIEDKPVVEPPPVAEVPPAAKGTGPQPPRFFLGLGVGVTNMNFVDAEVDVDSQTFAGLAASIDWRIGKGFMLGFSLDAQFTDIDYGFGSTQVGYFDLMMRLGYLIPLLDNKLLLHPYGQFGFGVLDYLDIDEADPDGSAILGFGFGARYMFLSWLGASVDLGVDYAYWMDSEEGTADVNFQIGLVLGF